MLTAPDYLTETLHVKISDECCFSKLSQPRKKRRRAWLTVHLAAWRSKVAFHICEVLHHWHCKQPREDRGRGEERWKHDACSRHQYDTRDRAQSNIYVSLTHTEALLCPALPSTVCVRSSVSLLSLTSPQMFCCQLSHVFTAEQRQAQQPEGIRFILGP